MADPQTYEEALEQGYQPIPDIGEFLAKRNITSKDFSLLKKRFSTQNAISCTTAPPGARCLDWPDDNGVRTICFCTPAKSCGNCVQK